MKILIRRMTAENIPFVSELLCSCYRWLAEKERFPDEFTDFLVNRRGSIATVECESQNQRYFVACHGRDIIGMVSINNDEITKLYVDPISHRQGVGKKLFDTAEDLIVKAGHNQIILGVLGKSALPFYRSMGMVISGRKKSQLDCYPQGEIVLMKKELNPVNPGQ